MSNFRASLQPFLDATGYEPKTTFWDDFSIADRFGTSAIKDTYKRAFSEWKSNVEYITELVLVLNWKIWYYNDTGNMALAELYNGLWEKTHDWCLNNLKGDDLSYYLRTVD